MREENVRKKLFHGYFKTISIKQEWEALTNIKYLKIKAIVNQRKKSKRIGT